MSPTSRRALAVLAVFVVLLVAACTDDDDGGSAPAESASTEASTTTTTTEDIVDSVQLSDCPPGTDDAGVTEPTSSSPGTIELVTTHPVEGAFAAASAISHGARARFAVENDRGGVEVAGRRYVVEVRALDDAGDPLSTQQHVAASFDPEESPAFATFGMVGTDNVMAVRDRLTGWCVPDVFPVSAAAEVSAGGGWSVGAPVVLETTEAAALVRYTAEIRPQARLALLLPAGDRGDRIEAAFASAVEATALTVVAIERVPVGVDTDVRAQVTALAGSGADVFVDAAELLSCPAAVRVADELSWPSLVLAAGGCAQGRLLDQAGEAADGVLSASNLIDPAADRWESDDRVVRYHRAVDTWADENDVDVDPEDPMVALGWTMGDLFVTALESADGMTRSELMAALTSLSATEPGLVLTGLTVATGPGDRWLGESARVVRFDASTGERVPVGAVSDHEGGAAVPEDLRPGS